MSKTLKSNNVKQNLLMNSLETFFKKENLDVIMPIINGQSKISLRVMDWFVTNYSKKNNISYLINKDGNIINSISDNQTGKEFVVYPDYKLQLKGYQKKQFDPFVEGRVLIFTTMEINHCNHCRSIKFFRWTIQNSVLTYISEHLEEIESDMNTCYKAIYNLEKNSDTANPREGNVKNYLFLQQKT